MDAVKKAWSRFQRTEVMRAWQRYSVARGNLLAGGVTYFAFFSIFPAVALAFTIFGALLRGTPNGWTRSGTTSTRPCPASSRRVTRD